MDVVNKYNLMNLNILLWYLFLCNSYLSYESHLNGNWAKYFNCNRVIRINSNWNEQLIYFENIKSDLGLLILLKATKKLLFMMHIIICTKRCITIVCWF